MNFISKYDGKNLDDLGSVVSDEYNAFQNAMKRDLSSIAKSINANLVWYSKGHYCQSAMFERNGHYVYFYYGSLSRCSIDLTGKHSSSFLPASYCRTAAHEKDFRGGRNVSISYSEVGATINNLLNTNHVDAF